MKKLSTHFRKTSINIIFNRVFKGNSVQQNYQPILRETSEKVFKAFKGK